MSRWPREESRQRRVERIDAERSRTASRESGFSPVASPLPAPAASTRSLYVKCSTADRSAGRSSMKRSARSFGAGTLARSLSWAPAGRDSHGTCDRTTQERYAVSHRCCPNRERQSVDTRRLHPSRAWLVARSAATASAPGSCFAAGLPALALVALLCTRAGYEAWKTGRTGSRSRQQRVASGSPR
jgi:hypothetical protein